MRKTRFVFTLLALRVLATSVMQIAAQAQGRAMSKVVKECGRL
jgi:hypothetical protein